MAGLLAGGVVLLRGAFLAEEAGVAREARVGVASSSTGRTKGLIVGGGREEPNQERRLGWRWSGRVDFFSWVVVPPSEARAREVGSVEGRWFLE